MAEAGQGGFCAHRGADRRFVLHFCLPAAVVLILYDFFFFFCI